MRAIMRSRRVRTHQIKSRDQDLGLCGSSARTRQSKNSIKERLAHFRAQAFSG